MGQTHKAIPSGSSDSVSGGDGLGSPYTGTESMCVHTRVCLVCGEDPDLKVIDIREPGPQG